MKSMINLLAIGLLLFGVGFGVSYYVLLPGDAGGDVAKAPEQRSDADPSVDPMLPAPAPDAQSVEKTDAMQVAFRTEKPISVEAVMQLSESIRAKESRLEERERQMLKEEQRLKQLFDDLKRGQDELEAFGESVDARVEVARQLLEQIKLERAGMQIQQQELASLQKKNPQPSADTKSVLDQRVDEVKGWFRTLEPETAARFIKYTANQGDIEFAAKILKSQEDKQAAKILAAFDDPALANQLMEVLVKERQ